MRSSRNKTIDLRVDEGREYLERCISVTAPAALTDVLDNFTDVSKDSEYAQAVAWAVNLGITKGTTDTTFSPDKTCTRGQIVTFLYRCYAAENDA